MCSVCESNHASKDWKQWDGSVEAHDVWADEDGGVHHVAETPIPEGVDVQVALYGRSSVDGSVFWIADFPSDCREVAAALVGQLEGMHAALAAERKEVARLTECLEVPVGYVNQGALAKVREQGVSALGVAISPTPNSHNNCAIYAQD